MTHNRTARQIRNRELLHCGIVAAVGLVVAVYLSHLWLSRPTSFPGPEEDATTACVKWAQTRWPQDQGTVEFRPRDAKVVTIQYRHDYLVKLMAVNGKIGFVCRAVRTKGKWIVHEFTFTTKVGMDREVYHDSN